MISKEDKRRFYKEAENFIIDFANLHRHDHISRNPDYNFLENCIIDYLDDEDIRKFLKTAIELRLELIRSICNHFQNNMYAKNFNIIQLALFYQKDIYPYERMLDRINDWTGYHGDFKEHRIMEDQIKKLTTLYGEEINYDPNIIKAYESYYYSMPKDQPNPFSYKGDRKPDMRSECTRYLNTYKNHDYEKDIRYQSELNFGYNHQMSDPQKYALGQYRKILKGNIGEWVMMDVLNGANALVFVANELGNMYGYDIYYYDLTDYKEKLIEAKATDYYTEDGYNDSFNIGITEVNKMQETLNDNTVDFVIKRVFLHFNQTTLDRAFITTLSPVDKETFVDEYGSVYKLKLDRSGNYYLECEELKIKNKLVRN